MSTIADLPEGWVRVRDSTRWRWGRGGGLEAEAAFWGPGATYAEFLKVVGGTEEEIEYPGGVIANRVVPLKFPSDSPEFSAVYASDCQLEGAGMPSEHPTEQIQYARARARVYFRSEPWYSFGSDFPLVSYSFSGGADFITMPGTAYRFPSDDTQLNQDVGILVPWRDFQLTFYNLAVVNEELYDALAGRVNSTPFMMPNGRIYDPGMVQYLAPSGQYSRTIGNQESWTVSHRLKLRYIPHNAIMRPDGTGFEVPLNSLGEPPIPSANLNLLYG